MSEQDPYRPPPGPKGRQNRPDRRFRKAQPSRVVRSDALEATRDIMAIIHAEVARYRRQTMLSPTDTRALLDLARTAKEARALEQLVEDDLNIELDALTDEELAARQGGESESS